ncbi:WYL domain-containing protein [Aeromicrobium camelliae]|uniref:WYL domain-containing protein n=1 Tax=Aeromicrobium camelliae TaxID=1538144 RepID=A0A3N6WJT0_9ACTN|nr:WYL domain-containing protein [Aeromicrobium camelliae]RQN07640.1 WYL domain-containing protein [Aeromicrobium camelliae]
MTTTSSQRLIRMLAMVPYLQSNAGVPVSELAATFGVSEAQITKDLSVLMMTGVGEYHGELIDVDLGALERDGVVYLRDADFMPRPLTLTTREASSLIVALRTLRQAATGDQRKAIDGALAKLEGAVGASAPVDVHLPNVDAGIKDTILSALSRGHQLDLEYVTAARDERTRRRVDPWRVFTEQGQLYLSAWCHRAVDVRTFRLDRIVAAEETDLPVERSRESAEGESDIPAALFTPGPDTPFAVLDLEPEALWLIDEYQAEVVEGSGDTERTRVRLYGSDLGWLRRLVLRNAGLVHVVEPRELADEVVAQARAALAAYDE